MVVIVNNTSGMVLRRYYTESTFPFISAGSGETKIEVDELGIEKQYVYDFGTKQFVEFKREESK